MNRIDTNMSEYLHTYEAYRVPKGTKVQDASGKEVVLRMQRPWKMVVLLFCCRLR